MVFMLFLSAVFANFLIITPTSATQQFVDTTPDESFWDFLKPNGDGTDGVLWDFTPPDEDEPDQFIEEHPDLLNPDGSLKITNSAENPCRDAAKGLSWIICSAVEVTSGLVDSVYGAISDMLVIQPLSFTQAPVESTQNSTDNDNPGVARPS